MNSKMRISGQEECSYPNKDPPSKNQTSNVFNRQGNINKSENASNCTHSKSIPPLSIPKERKPEEKLPSTKVPIVNKEVSSHNTSKNSNSNIISILNRRRKLQ